MNKKIIILLFSVIFLSPFKNSFCQQQKGFFDAKELKPQDGVHLVTKNDALPISDKGVSFTYLTRLSQNAIENNYKSFFRSQGFKYRKDKDLRTGMARRFRFDKDDLAVDISLASRGAKGTMILVMQYFTYDANIDLKDLGESYKWKPELPEYSPEEKFSTAPFTSQGKTQYSQGYSLFEIPAPQGAEIVDTKSSFPLTGGTGKAVSYNSNQSPQAVEKFYADFFKKSGFKIRKDKQMKVGDMKRMRFEREDLAVDLMLKNREKGCLFTIIKYPGPNIFSAAENNPFFNVKMPTKDVATNVKLKDIPRPNKSVLFSGNERGKKTYMTYFSQETTSNLRDFYMRQLLNSGWRLENQLNFSKIPADYGRKNNKPTDLMPSVQIAQYMNLKEVLGKSFCLDFISVSGKVRIMVYPNFAQQNKGSMVDIIYTRN